MAITGPALRHLDSHRSIHQGAYAEARDITDVMNRLFYDNRMEDCLKAANALVEYWETRVIAHADTEDEGFYKELLEKKPELTKEIHMFSRDHDLFRKIVADIKEEISEEEKVTKNMVNQFNALLIIKKHHNKGEEENLFTE
ncbi:hypothetical protein CIL03_03275 [Virgibacillus indicus]|uniref:Hemerythrin-like domain-containing protein n=1 Tax=Virgibacillus indicus TaxID=2024554 RepID=A0A265NDR7_9BACI|nr:hemerythrin domain-containing protein [Virgibacillus indicus]OZU90178.1 hypothetical protein CIL03_03275 [Virgibacillus indicus]